MAVRQEDVVLSDTSHCCESSSVLQGCREKTREAAAVLSIFCPSRQPRIEVGFEKFTRNHR